MGVKLSTYTNSRDNNFNLIRLFAALLVLYTHSFALALGTSDAEPLLNLLGITWGNIAVDLFFITSGFLITSSYLSRNNILIYAWARILRIYPALIASALFSALVIGLIFTSLSMEEYLTNKLVLKYILKNIILVFGVEYRLPGVFTEIAYPGTVNGCLWTLPHELRMYILLALILLLFSYFQKWFRIKSPKIFSLIIMVTALIANITNHYYPFAPVSFLHLFTMFFSGSTYFICREHITLSLNVFLLAFILLIISSLNREVFFNLYILTLPYIILFIVYVPTGTIRKFNNFGDYSYGIYIYGFPIQQSLSALMPNLSVPTMLISSFCLTSILAILSWHLMEKQFLKLKDKFKNLESFQMKSNPTN